MASCLKANSELDLCAKRKAQCAAAEQITCLTYGHVTICITARLFIVVFLLIVFFATIIFVPMLEATGHI